MVTWTYNGINPFFYNDKIYLKSGDVYTISFNDSGIYVQNVESPTKVTVTSGESSWLIDNSIRNDVVEHHVDGEDMVNHPPYYTDIPGVECIDVASHFDFCIGCAIKYLWRNGKKEENGVDKKEKQIEDLRKAIWYIEREIKLLENV